MKVYFKKPWQNKSSQNVSRAEHNFGYDESIKKQH